MKQEYGTLTKNAAMFVAANISGKILKLLIIPMYTYYLSSAQFGAAETISVTASLLCPVLLLGTNEAAIRFTMDKAYSVEDTASNCFAILLMSALPVLMISILLYHFSSLRGHILLLSLIVISGAIEAIMMSLAKGAGRNGVFAVSEVVAAVVLVCSNLIALAALDAGAEGYLLSVAAASIGRTVYIELKIKVLSRISRRYVSVKTITDILKFSLPLMPNALLWWAIDSSDRYVIMWMLGASSVGIYAIACRLSSAFTGLAFILHQAWQLSAIRKFFSSDFKEFYKTVSDIFITVFFGIAAVLIAFVRPVISILDYSYNDAWKYAPFLLISAVFAGLSGFVGINYTASGKTRGALTSTIAGAAANIALTPLLTHYAGLYGTAISTLIAYYILWLLRMIDAKRLIGGVTGFALVHMNLLILLAESVCVLTNDRWYLTALCFVVFIAANRKIFCNTLKLFSNGNCIGQK